MNMVGQNTPWGTLDYAQTGSTWITDPNGKRVEIPTYTANVGLTPEQQAIFERTQEAETNLAQIAADQSARVGDILNTPFEFTNRDAETWAYDLASPRILQQQQQAEQALRTQLINSGMRPGTAQFDQQMAMMRQAQGDQLNQLALTGRQQAFSEALAMRNQPLNEIIGLTSGTQIQNPTASFAQTPQSGVAGVDYTGLVQNKYNADMQNYRGMMGGLFGLGSALIGLSDRRAKRDIRKIGRLPNGLNWYSFRYAGGVTLHEGVMSDEVRVIMPDAVTVGDDGLDRVDYGMVLA